MSTSICDVEGLKEQVEIIDQLLRVTREITQQLQTVNEAMERSLNNEPPGCYYNETSAPPSVIK